LSSSASVYPTITRSEPFRSRKPTRSRDPSDCWPSHKSPMLRLDMSSSLESIPASPLAEWTPSVYSSHSSSSSIDEHEGQQFTIRPHADLPSQSSPTPPSFVIPSANLERRNKMERLRRKLGDDVPLDLVFPIEEEPIHVSQQVVEGKDILIPPVMPSNQRAPVRISSARDSIFACDSPHRARRKTTTAKASPAVPLPSLPENLLHRQEEKHHVKIKGQHYVGASLDMRDVKAKLCVIVESPSEHGLGCTEGFGVGRLGSYGVTLESEWYGSDDEAGKVKSWSTRRGYAGWAEASWPWHQ